jgi:hypothetical protein
MKTSTPYFQLPGGSGLLFPGSAATNIGGGVMVAPVIVQNGQTYSISDGTGTFTLTAWKELR